MLCFCRMAGWIWRGVTGGEVFWEFADKCLSVGGGWCIMGQAVQGTLNNVCVFQTLDLECGYNDFTIGSQL